MGGGGQRCAWAVASAVGAGAPPPPPPRPSSPGPSSRRRGPPCRLPCRWVGGRALLWGPWRRPPNPHPHTSPCPIGLHIPFPALLCVGRVFSVQSTSALCCRAPAPRCPAPPPQPPHVLGPEWTQVTCQPQAARYEPTRHWLWLRRFGDGEGGHATPVRGRSFVALWGWGWTGGCPAIPKIGIRSHAAPPPDCSARPLRCIRSLYRHSSGDEEDRTHPTSVLHRPSCTAAVVLYPTRTASVPLETLTRRQ